MSCWSPTRTGWSFLQKLPQQQHTKNIGPNYLIISHWRLFRGRTWCADERRLDWESMLRIIWSVSRSWSGFLEPSKLGNKDAVEAALELWQADGLTDARPSRPILLWLVAAKLASFGGFGDEAVRKRPLSLAAAATAAAADEAAKLALVELPWTGVLGFVDLPLPQIPLLIVMPEFWPPTEGGKDL